MKYTAEELKFLIMEAERLQKHDLVTFYQSKLNELLNEGVTL